MSDQDNSSVRARRKSGIAKNCSQSFFFRSQESNNRAFEVLGEDINEGSLVVFLTNSEEGLVISENISVLDVENVGDLILVFLVQIADLKVSSVVADQLLDKHDVLDIILSSDVVLQSSEKRRVVTEKTPIESVSDDDLVSADIENGIAIVGGVVELDDVKVVLELDVDQLVG